MASREDWAFTLIVFNLLLVAFMGFYGGTFGDDNITVEEKGNTLLPNFSFDVVTGFEAMPDWLNVIFVAQGIFAIYLIFATIFG